MTSHFKKNLCAAWKSVALCVAGAAIAIAITACYSTPSVNTVENANAGAKKKLVSDKRIYTDSGTANIADPIEIRTGTTPAGTLKIQVELMNSTSYVGRVFYLFEWFDEDGMKIEMPEVWNPLVIPPGKVESLTDVAPNDRAKDFRLSLIRRE